MCDQSRGRQEAAPAEGCQAQTLVAPKEGLKTYLQYAVLLTPIDDATDLASVKAAKQTRRKMIQTFTQVILITHNTLLVKFYS